MPRSRLLLLTASALLLVAPARLASQQRPVEKRDTVPAVPREMLPPPGKCRIWVTGVPAKQQPAPTDCATAVRQNPTNGIVLYGPAIKDDDSERFEFSFRAGTAPAAGQVRRASLTERRDSLKSSKSATPSPRAPAAKDAERPRTDSVKKPAEPAKPKPEKP